MWICPVCNEKIEDIFDSCWQCSIVDRANEDAINHGCNESIESRYQPGTLINEIIVKDAKGFLKGNISLSSAFWLFGIFFGSILSVIVGGFALLLLFIFEKLGLNSESSILVLPDFFRLILWIVLSIGIWKCGNNSSVIWKWVSRIVYIGFGGYYYTLSLIFAFSIMAD